MSKQAYETKLAAIDRLREAMDEVPLRKALKEKNNYLVARAAAVVGDLRLPTFVPDLLTAYARFFESPSENDKQCWAKNALAKALKDLEHRDAAPFLRGLRHVQMEPTYGGKVDTAATLRGTCALALLTTDLPAHDVLTELLPLLRDPEKPVRLDAIRAVSGLGSQQGALLLRLLAITGDPEPEVTGEAFAGLLALQPAAAVPFVAGYLRGGGECAAEAAAALAVAREPAALAALREAWEGRLSRDVRRTLLLSLAGSPLAESAVFLREVIRDGPDDQAVLARQALSHSRFKDA